MLDRRDGQPTRVDSGRAVSPSADSVARDRPPTMPALLRLQRTAGNGAVSALVGSRAAYELPAVQRSGTGLAAEEALARATAALSGSVGADAHWTNPTGYGRTKADKRINLFAGPLKAEFERMRIPWPVPQIGPDLLGVSGSTFAAFNPELWLVFMSPDALRDDNANKETKTRIAGSFYHELRHAEQFFRMARFLAGKQMGEADIRKQLGMSPSAVAEAVKMPLTTGKKGGSRQAETEAAEAEAWMRYLDRYAEVRDGLKKAEEEYTKSASAFKAEQSQTKARELQRAIENYRGFYRAYQMTAVEADAWKVAGSLEKSLGGVPNTLDRELEKMPSLRTLTKIVAPEASSLRSPSGAQAPLERPRSPLPDLVPPEGASSSTTEIPASQARIPPSRPRAEARPVPPPRPLPSLVAPPKQGASSSSPNPNPSRRIVGVPLPGLVPSGLPTGQGPPQRTPGLVGTETAPASTTTDLQKSADDTCQRHAMPAAVEEAREALDVDELREAPAVE